ncbi:MAG: hypothetical protein JXB13_13445 [Phycisphaerae bacterium]|nr:hypothetical protein [Phycisphaerae bacterium]
MSDSFSTTVDTKPSAYVAAQLPPTAPLPAPRRKINFLLALLVHWLIPGRFGPHLAAGSTARACLATIVSLSFVVGAVIVHEIQEERRFARPHVASPYSRSSSRERLAEEILRGAAQSTGANWSWMPFIGVASTPLLIELGLLIFATALMPWAAGGDRAWSVWKRSVRNVHWSLTILVPVAAVVAVLACINVNWDHWQRWPDAVIISIGIVVFLTPVILLLRMWFVGAHRYVGPPDGPAFAPREPLCDACGYAIVHLPLETRCPECGLPVRESLPGGRRRPTPWVERRWRPSGLFWLLRLQWQILRRPAFFERLPVHSGIESARHFWWMTVAFMILVSLAVIRLSVSGLGSHSHREFEAAGITTALAMGSVLATLLLQMLSMFPLCLWAQKRYGIVDYRVSASACCMATPLVWPLLIVLLVCTLAPVLNEQWLRGVVVLSLLDRPVSAWLIVAIASTALVLLAAIFWLRRVTAALRAVRYANV